METIIERARKYGGQEYDYFDNLVDTDKTVGFTVGAIEQKDIDKQIFLDAIKYAEENGNMTVNGEGCIVYTSPISLIREYLQKHF